MLTGSKRVFGRRVTSRSQMACALFLICAITAAAGCGAPEEPEQVEPEQSVGIDWSGKNCLVVVLDALTVNHLALWGYDRETTPNIDRLAKRGVVFKFARSQGSSTPPSAYSYFVGRYPPFLARSASNALVQLPPEETTFAEAFDEAGYDTAAFSGNIFVAEKTGFGQGFDAFELILRHLPVSSYEIELDQQSTFKLVTAARTWIQAREENPWLCYLHLLRPHNPYPAPRPYARSFARGYRGPVDGSDEYWKSVNWKPPREHMPRLKDFYDGNLHYTDALLGAFLDQLDASGDLDDTAIIVTSDHGEAFMEHGLVLHNATVYEELIHVPFILIPPASSGVQAREVLQPVQLVDMLPTMTALFGLKTPSNVDGVSLEPLLRGELLPERSTFAQDGKGSFVCIIEQDHKLHLWFNEDDAVFKPHAYFRLTRDPGERINLWNPAIPPPKAVELFERAGRYIDSHMDQQSGDTGNLEDYEKEVLETLGYL